MQRWRLVHRRSPLPAGKTPRDQVGAWEAALGASGLPLVRPGGPAGRLRLATAAPLPVGLEGEAELLDLWLTERRARWQVREAITAALPPGMALVDVYDVWLGEPPLPGQVVASVYRATILREAVDGDRLRNAARSLVAATSLERERRKGDAVVRYDLRWYIGAVEVVPVAGGRLAVRMTLRHDPERGVGRPDEVLAALSETLGVRLEPPVLAGITRERLVLSTDRPRD